MFNLGFGELVFLAVFSLLPGLVAAVVASRKGRSAFGWFLLGALLPPMVVIVFFLSPVGERAEKQPPP